ncbi:MAG: hypothetical protein R6U98_24350 [Pirellulaceae bacterium]
MSSLSHGPSAVLVNRQIIVDGRNLYDPAHMGQLGFTYASVGRRTVAPMDYGTASERRERNHERELLAQGIPRTFIRRDKFAPLAFREGDVKAVVQTRAGLRGDGRRPAEKRLIGVNLRQIAQNVVQQAKCVPDRNDLLTLTFRQRARRFSGKDGGGEQSMNPPLVVLTRTQCSGR